MNAYEMADELLRDNTQLTVKAAYMLRQQANRIVELEKELYFKNYYEELPDTPVGIIGKIGDSPIHDLVHRTTPQIKELSDEEIRVFMSEMPHLTERKDLLMFARAILKKASEK
jgi:hypothetical protein